MGQAQFVRIDRGVQDAKGGFKPVCVDRSEGQAKK